MSESHQARLDPFSVVPEAQAAMWGLQKFVDASGLDHKMMELIKTRASQINGCARCIIIYTRDARKHGETEERLYLVAAWREAVCFTPRERAALEWTEALTNLNSSPIEHTVYERVKHLFTDEEMVKLTLAVIAINSWNRLNVGFAIPFVEKPRITVASGKA